jgi:hypothetical protein
LPGQGGEQGGLAAAGHAGEHHAQAVARQLAQQGLEILRRVVVG